MIETYPYNNSVRGQELIYPSGTPLLVFCKNGNKDLLVHWHGPDESGLCDLWDIFPLTPEQLADYLAGNVSLRTLFEEIDNHMRIAGDMHSPLSFEWKNFSQWPDSEKPSSMLYHTDLQPVQ